MAKNKNKNREAPQVMQAARATERAARVQHMADSGGRSAFRSITMVDRRARANRRAARRNNRANWD